MLMQFYRILLQLYKEEQMGLKEIQNVQFGGGKKSVLMRWWCESPGHGTIRWCGLVGVGVVPLEEVCHCGVGL